MGIVPINGGRSDDVIAAEFANTMREMTALDQENERRLDALRRRDRAIGAAARRAAETILAQALLGLEGSRLVGMRKAAKIIGDYELRGAEILNEQRERRADEQRRELAMAAALAEEQAAAHVRSHPLSSTEIVKMAEGRGAVLRLGDGVIEAAPSGTLDLVAKMYIRASAREVAGILDARTRFEVIAKVPRDD